MRRNVAALLVAFVLLCGRPLRAKAEGESSAAEACAITGLSVLQTTEDGVQAEVVFTAIEQAELVVALYDEADDRVMLACGAQEVAAGQEKCIIFAAWSNEAYSSFKVAAYLIEPKSETLLCPSAYIVQSAAAKAETPDREDEATESAGSAAALGDFADCVKAPYENAYLLAYTLARQDQQGYYLSDPFARESLLYLAQRSGEELLTFSMEIPTQALVICNPCGFADAPILLQEEEEGKAASGEGEIDKTEAGVDPAGAGGTGSTGSTTAAVDDSQSMIASGSAQGGTQALWVAAAGAGIVAAAVVAKKLFAQKEEQAVQIDLQTDRWAMRLSDNAAAQSAQQGQQSSAPAEEQAAAANG
jgi:hypothetical protein